MPNSPRSRVINSIPLSGLAWIAVVVTVSGLLAAVAGPPPARSVRAASALPDSTVSRRVGWTVTGGSTGSELGYAVARAGDVNGDGFDDVIVGAPRYSDTVDFRGRAAVYLGSATGLADTAAWTAVGGSESAYFGRSVASAGDINHDGKSDFIVGEPGFDDGTNGVGRVHVFYGSDAGISSSPAWTVAGTKDLALFGYAVAGVFDLNGDGYGDVLVGAPDEEVAGSSYVGCAYAFFGSLQGLATSPSWSACGTGEHAFFGESLSAAGDVNGDLVDDIVIGSRGYTGTLNHEGRAYVYHGSKGSVATSPSWTAEGSVEWEGFGYSVAGAGDVNKDGFPDVIVGAYGYSGAHEYEGRAYLYRGSSTGLAATPAWTVEGGQAYSGLGETVASGRDVNNDGYSDVLVGGSDHDGDRPGEGRVLVFAGSAGGLASTPAWAATGPQIGSWFGSSLGAGRFDGDALADIVVGAPMYTDEHAGEGAAFVYLGGDPPGSEFVVDSPADDADSADAVRGDGKCEDAQGRCTLRAAVHEANALTGPDLVTFARSMTVTVGSLLGELPNVTEQVALDASGVWNHAGDRPGVVLDGAGADHEGLHIMADGVTVFGIMVTGFADHGIIVDGADNVIGGPTEGQRNVVSGNSGTGVVLWDVGTERNIVQSNYIGLAPDGLTPLPNHTGVWIGFAASNTLVGAETPDRDNVISGNTSNGVTIDGAGSDYNWVLSNTLGMSHDGSVAVGNRRGIYVGAETYGTAIGWVSEIPVEGAVAVSVGEAPTVARMGARTGARTGAHRGHAAWPARSAVRSQDLEEMPFGDASLIAGNLTEGVLVEGPGGFTGVSSNTIRDNGAQGVVVSDRPNCRINDNIITGNQLAGVEVAGTAARPVLIEGNRIWDNDGKGIALLDGANGGIAPPTIAQANSAGAAGTTCSMCLVLVYSDAADEGEHPEMMAEADAAGAWLLVYPLRGPNITAITSNDSDGSSEFSAPFSIAEVPTPTATTTSAATATEVASATPTATETATPAPTATSTVTPSATPTPMPTETASPSTTPSATPTATASPTAGPTDTATATSTSEASPTSAPTNMPTETPTPARTPGSEHSVYAPLVLKRAAP